MPNDNPWAAVASGTPTLVETPIVPDTPASTETTLVETPPVTTEPTVDTPTTTAEPTVREVIKEVPVEVIKEVYKDPTFTNETSKRIYEELQAGNEDALANYLEEKRRNYNTMSDMDVVRHNLKKSNPDWSDKDIESEVKYKYGKSFDKIDVAAIDPDDTSAIERAERHNDAVDERLLLLERDGRDARIALNKQKETIELPKIPTQQAPATNTPDEAALASQKKEWEQYVDTSMPTVEDYKFEVEGEEVPYKITDDERSAMSAEMRNYDPAKTFTEMGWRDENGTLNPARIAKDMHQLRNIKNIVASAFTAGKEAGKKAVIAEDIKNLSFTPGTSGQKGTPKNPWQMVGDKYS